MYAQKQDNTEMQAYLHTAADKFPPDGRKDLSFPSRYPGLPQHLPLRLGNCEGLPLNHTARTSQWKNLHLKYPQYFHLLLPVYLTTGAGSEADACVPDLSLLIH